ncbi:MAG TPA: cation:dicarboxylase symporter family transporter [Vicinamibacterales bacterium]|nr:cation:dicarboxylase symporter family transporter [Vicinamibacterales bacterium]
MRPMSFSTKILVGLAAGILLGLLLGERAGVLAWAAEGFVRLLQMTVLPYVTLSIIGSLGSLQLHEARRLALRAGAVLVVLWGIALSFALVIPVTFPGVESASFFSTTLVERRPPFDFVNLYIPSNPFHSLANNVVPAVVLFSVIVGVALIGVPRRQIVLDVLGVAGDALSRATRLIAGLTPYGLFAIAANAAGTMSLEQIGRLQVYVVSYVLVALLVSLWVLPGLVAALTPIRVREIFALTRNALITAFVTGDLFIVLPVLIASSRTLIEQHGLAGAHASALPDVIVPASFNFPHTGKLLSLSFVLFAGWFADAAVPLAEYPRLAFTGLVTFFGSLNVAVPFLLDLFRIPADTFQLFLASGVINSRFGTLVAAVHTIAVALLGTCAMAGALRWDRGSLLRYAAVTLTLTVAVLGGTRLLFSQVLDQRYTKDQVLAGMHLLRGSVDAIDHETTPAPPASAEGSRLQMVRTRGVLRVGYLPASLPFAFRNASGELVGFDVELAHRLAAELQVRLELVPLDRAGWPEQLAAGASDLVMSGIAVTTDRASRMTFSTSYMDETVALVVRDADRSRFASWEGIRAAGPVTIAAPDVPYYVAMLRELLPGATIRTSNDIESMLANAPADVDAIALPAERGSAWTLLYPQFTVVVPDPAGIRVPLAYPLAGADQAFASFINTWIELKRKDRTLDALYDYWILGRNAEPRRPRWSILRNVLGWVD